MRLRRAVVFPGQGVEGGEISGRVEEVVSAEVGDDPPPYQLSVFASSVALFDRLEGAGVEVVAGHSLGEYGAAYAAGSLGLEDAVRLVAERDRLMMQCARKTTGGMTALVGPDPSEVEEVVAEELERGEVVVAANFNTPRQTVLSGEKDAVEAAAARLDGRKFELEVTGAFHSPLMMDASQEMDGLLSEAGFFEPEIPMISGADGSLLEGADEIRGALRSQMLSPVRWTAVVEKIASLGVEEVVEAGDGGTLVRMLRDFKELNLKGRKASEAIS